MLAVQLKVCSAAEVTTTNLITGRLNLNRDKTPQTLENMLMMRIELTQAEKQLWDKIDFNPSAVRASHESLRASCESAHDLAHSLLERKAIPEIRLRYFTDPNLNIGSKKSRKERLEGNGTRGDDILRDGNFLPYLHYFVVGPNLPDETFEAFQVLLNDLGMITSGDVEELIQFARREARRINQDMGVTAEEFFKLGLEYKLDVDYARAMRDAVMRLKKK